MLKSIISFLLSVFTALTGALFTTVGERAADFRIVAYCVGNNFTDPARFEAGHFEKITDAILIGVSNFNEKGEIAVQDNFDTIVSNLKAAMEGTDAKLYVNLIGPGASGSFPTWDDQMNAQSVNHEKAFDSGVLEDNIKAFLDEYGFDGVFFDYEYPVTKAHRHAFGDFIVSLRETLGDEYVIGAAISSWCADIGRKAIGTLDMVEVMAYDMWTKDGIHASFKDMKGIANAMVAAGYSKKKLDIGVPFYARPTTQDAYWYGYNGWWDKLDEKGLCYDEATGLTFSFNDYDVIAQKTEWMIRNGFGGAMVWHYSCDVAADNEKSLFSAMYNTKTALMSERGC